MKKNNKKANKKKNPLLKYVRKELLIKYKTHAFYLNINSEKCNYIPILSITQGLHDRFKYQFFIELSFLIFSIRYHNNRLITFDFHVIRLNNKKKEYEVILDNGIVNKISVYLHKLFKKK